MSAPAVPVPPPFPKTQPPPSAERTLRKLFLTLFLRGRSSRGLKKSTAPTSIWQKLGMALFFYALFGAMAAVSLHSQPIFALSVYLHALTFVFLGMFVAASAGEILFNKEEADILLHRPIDPRTMLWAKIRVLIEVSLWLAGALNLGGFIAGLYTPDGGWLYAPAHVVSTVAEALFCTGCVVLIYQLCLRWAGRERLDGLMTTAQVLMAVVAVVGGQIVPRVMFRLEGVVLFTSKSWWVALLPPSWFAGIDDALVGTHAVSSWLLAAIALAGTVVVVWLAFGKLAGGYEHGLQAMGETVSQRKPRRAGRRWLDVLVHTPPLSWFLREPVTRASFLLTLAYLVRDRDVKLRIYPGIAPMMVMPFIFLFQPDYHGGGGGFGHFGIGFASVYLGILPMFGMSMLQYSQQWAASDVFRAAPMAGPKPLCDGARLAVMCVLALPALIVFAVIVGVAHGFGSELLLLLPGVISLPVYGLVPCLGGSGVPLSLPTEEAKSASRGLMMLPVMLISMAVAGIALWAWQTGWFWWFMLAETILVAVIYTGMRASLANAKWEPME